MTARALKQAGLKVTPARLRILELFQASRPKHLTADDVFCALKEAGDDVSLATVYRVLAQFETHGILQRHDFDQDVAVYEMDDGEHHDHLVCVECGVVHEFMDEVIEERQRLQARAHGYQLTRHALVLFGVCPRCQDEPMA